MIGIVVLTAAIADAEVAQRPVHGQAIPVNWPAVAPTVAQPPRHQAEDRRSATLPGAAGKSDRLQEANSATATVSRSGARRRFLYGTAALAHNQPWVEAQTGAPRTYVASMVAAELQMGGAVSANP